MQWEYMMLPSRKWHNEMGTKHRQKAEKTAQNARQRQYLISCVDTAASPALQGFALGLGILT